MDSSMPTDATPLAVPAAGSAPSSGPTKPMPKTSRHRFKPQLSCTFCRNRKLKCDRNQPCENCLKRNQASSCTYMHAARDKPFQVSKAATAASASKDIQSQIRHLEGLVVSLMNQTSDKSSSESLARSLNLTGSDSSPSQSAAPTLSDTADSIGRINLEDDQRSYVGSSHWTAILDSIAGLKEQLGNSEPVGKDNKPILTGPALLVGSVKAATRSEILMALPARPIADRLVEKYFIIRDMGSIIIHGPTFQKEYKKFWEAPQGAPIMWIGQLFGILCLAMQLQYLADEPTPEEIFSGLPLKDPVEIINILHEKTIQCLILGNYTEPGPCTVETLLLYYISDHFRTSDTQFGTWMVFGLIVRSAMRLGMHRDASHYPSISPARGEMQRRIWAILVHMDLQTSLHVGLPKMISEAMYDTELPGNLLDEDFDENTKVLPPARKDDEVTSVLYSNTKNIITKVAGSIFDLANATHSFPYEEVMKLDARLHDVYTQTPEMLKVRSLEDFGTGSPVLRIRKFSVDLTFQKARCILHRKFFIPTKSGTLWQYPYSMKACIDSSMRILQSQIIMYGDSKTGQVLQVHKWRTSSLVTHDFFLAAMLICLYLSHDRIKSRPPEYEDTQSVICVTWAKGELIKVLIDTKKIWDMLTPTSKEAAKAANVLNTILKRVGGLDVETKPPNVQSAKTADIEMPLIVNKDTNSSGTSSAFSETPMFDTNSDSLPSAWVLAPEFMTQEQLMAPSTIQIPPSGTQMPGSETFDWELWDRQIYTGALVDTPPELLNFAPNFAPMPTPWYSDENFLGPVWRESTSSYNFRG